MTRGAVEPPVEPPGATRQDSLGRRAIRATVLAATFVFVLAALFVSIALVVYTAWLHDLLRGAFALLFAVLSTQMALNWLLWKEDEA